VPRTMVGGFLSRERRRDLGGWYLVWRSERHETPTCFSVGYVVSDAAIAEHGRSEEQAWEAFMVEFAERVARELAAKGVPHPTAQTELSAKRDALEQGLAIQRWFEGLCRVFGRAAGSWWEKNSGPVMR
jgi:hypothetical protein